MSGALTWYYDWSPLITAALGGGLAMIAAALLFMVATALGPDLPVLQCVGPKARAFLHFTAFTWFVRGAMVLTSIGKGDRHPHWDMPVAWACTVGLCAYALAYLWSQRMPPEVRDRFDRRELFRRKRVQELVADGRPADAKLAAEGIDARAVAYEVGVSPAALDALRGRPDPYAT